MFARLNTIKLPSINKLSFTNRLFSKIITDNIEEIKTSIDNNNFKYDYSKHINKLDINRQTKLIDYDISLAININKLNENIQKDIINKNPLNLQYIKNPNLSIIKSVDISHNDINNYINNNKQIEDYTFKKHFGEENLIKENLLNLLTITKPAENTLILAKDLNNQLKSLINDRKLQLLLNNTEDINNNIKDIDHLFVIILFFIITMYSIDDVKAHIRVLSRDLRYIDGDLSSISRKINDKNNKD